MRLFPALAIALLTPLAAQTVTATKVVSHLNKKEVLRKINNRWWTQDNREVNPPGKGGVFWVYDSEPGVVDFYHHQPCDLARAESLHLFMPPESVEAVMGKPNRIFKMGPDGGMWTYYAENGTRVEVRIMDGVLGEAEYQPVGGKSTPVASVARDLGGRSIFSLLAERAGQRSSADQAQRVAALQTQRPTPSRLGNTRPSMSIVSANVPPAAAPTAEPKKHIVSPEALAGIKLGASRADVLAALGEPSARFSIAGGDELRETFRYHRADGRPVDIKLVDGKVVVIP